MDLLLAIGDFWICRRAHPTPSALEGVRGLTPATVITGASEGLGLALAELIAREGRVIVLLARHEEALRHAAEALRHNHSGARVIAAALDVGQPR